MIDAESFDMVLVTVKMPGMTGEEFYDELARKAPDVMSRVVFMTGDTVSKRTREFLERAERPVVEKPFDVQTLEGLMARELVTRA